MGTRGRKATPKCEWGDCFTCPYPDCIDNRGGESLSSVKRSPGRPKLPPGVVEQHQREYAKKHYQANKEKKSAYYKEYYQKNKEKIHAQQKQYRERRKLDGILTRQNKGQ